MQGLEFSGHAVRVLGVQGFASDPENLQVQYPLNELALWDAELNANPKYLNPEIIKP